MSRKETRMTDSFVKENWSLIKSAIEEQDKGGIGIHKSKVGIYTLYLPIRGRYKSKEEAKEVYDKCMEVLIKNKLVDRESRTRKSPSKVMLAQKARTELGYGSTTIATIWNSIQNKFNSIEYNSYLNDKKNKT